MSDDNLTPMMRQYRRIRDELEPDVLLFFRMGDFYEFFFEDSTRAAPILGVAVTRRAGVPMCGVPYHALDAYLAKVVRAGLKAAVCDQVEDPATAKGIVRREIVRVVTPGSVLEDAILDASANNYLAAVYNARKRGFGLALLELSTGVMTVEDCPSAEALAEALRRAAPSETVVSEDQAGDPELQPLLRREITGSMTCTEAWRFLDDQAADVLKRHFRVHSLEGFCGEAPAAWINPAGALIHYVRESLRQNLDHVRTLNVSRGCDALALDACTCRNLDLLPLPGKPAEETLYGVLDHTATPMGARLLRQWLRTPLCAAAAINARLDAVEAFTRNRRALGALSETLREVRDLERLITRLASGSGNARDLRAMASSMAAVPPLATVLEPFAAAETAELRARLHPLPELVDELNRALVESPPIPVKEGGLIQPGYNAELDELRALAQEGHSWLARYQASEQERTGIKTLKVRHNNIFGYYIEISKGQAASAPENYERRQTLVNAERFITPELKEYETKIVGAQDKACALEYALFLGLRERAAAETAAVQETAAAIAKLDVLLSFADRALALGYTRPEVNDSDRLVIREGRHPVVEQQPDAERFVPNDADLNGTDQQFLLITGPNMAGKSTYIRQVAVIAIMAHLGSFVPAKSAEIGVIDRVFTRVGAGDDLARGRSTFMVEMQEAANILNNATARSLIVLDEIGRGTSTFDGISIAWAVAEYLHNDPGRKARTLFATHYHELTDLAQTLSGLKNYTVQIREQGDTITFLRRIVPGTADKSYGIHVARLAGMPSGVIDRANEILLHLENSDLITPGMPKPHKTRRRSTDDATGVLPLFETFFDNSNPG